MMVNLMISFQRQALIALGRCGSLYVYRLMVHSFLELCEPRRTTKVNTILCYLEMTPEEAEAREMGSSADLEAVDGGDDEVGFLVPEDPEGGDAASELESDSAFELELDEAQSDDDTEPEGQVQGSGTACAGGADKEGEGELGRLQVNPEHRDEL